MHTVECIHSYAVGGVVGLEVRRPLGEEEEESEADLGESRG